jgi:hypothetical protein
MMSSYQLAHITRRGAAIAGSPFLVKLRYRRLHIEPQIAPIAARRPVQEFLIFVDRLASVSVGDIITLPGDCPAKIIDVRRYPGSLQCMLQRLPYAPCTLWIPLPPQIGADKSLPDAAYVSAGTVLALLEPSGEQSPGVLPVGQTDRRRCWVFSATPLSILSVLAVDGCYWQLTASSSVWPISDDFRAPACRLSAAPLGVS